jgi:hypothetical protein
MFFVIGDYLAGMTVGALTALAVRMVVASGMDMVVAMLIGMALGMAVHITIGLLFAPIVGKFKAMIQACVIGIYGGVFFGMGQAMAAGCRTFHAAVDVASDPTKLGLAPQCPPKT